MRVTFASNFEARTFMNRYDENKSNDDVPSIWMRPYTTKEAQTKYNKKKAQMKELKDAEYRKQETTFDAALASETTASFGNL